MKFQMATLDLQLTIRARETVEYDGRVLSITSFNDRGKFDVTPNHANFISLIKDKILINKTDGTQQEFKLNRAVMRVEGNKIGVYLGIKRA